MSLLPVFSILLLAAHINAQNNCGNPVNPPPGTAQNVNVQTLNNCAFPVWPGILNGLPGLALPENGGYKLNPGENKTLSFSYNWQGRIWARTGCDETTWACETGGCTNALQCAGTGGAPPASLAEFTLDGSGPEDYYDISFVDGYNIPVSMQPVQGTYQLSSGGPYDCTEVGQVYQDINAECPSELQVINASGQVVACKSACTAFNTDYYCCRGDYNSPTACNSATWPVNYPQIFKTASPTSYSYAYDDAKSTFTCRGISSLSPDYLIQFC